MMKLALLAAAAIAPTALAAVPGDKVATLPGFGAPPTQWYSGYLDIPGGKHLHYVFIESPNPTTDPISLWMNGGPGCSSLEGLFAEHGQLFVDENDPTKLVVNPDAWTNISSFIYLESPACVGYSYADTLAGCVHDDNTSAIDNYAAMLKFFTLYPEYSANDFYITGESYAGIYVPSLAAQIVNGNKAGNPKINLVGIAVGNGCLGNAAGQCAFNFAVERDTNMPYFVGHGLIAPTTWAAVQKDCPSDINPSAQCETDVNNAHAEVGNVNIYNIYGDCIFGQTPGKIFSRAPVAKPVLGGPIECIDETIAKYIGTPAVAAALNVISTLNWAVCGSNSSFQYSRSEPDERTTIYPTIINSGYVRVVIYNGEADACVPWLDNEAWTRSLGLPVVAPWAPWTSVGQVAGYSIGYSSNFSFVTVKGAGHMVPGTQPVHGWTLFSNFVNAAPWV